MSSVIRTHPRPTLTPEQALEAVRALYGLEGTFTRLPGERDLNFRLEAPDGASYVVKFASPAEPQEILEFEARMIARLAAETGGLVPEIVPTRTGELLGVWEAKGEDEPHRIRVMRYVPGVLLAEVAPPRPLALLRDLGRKLARLSSALGAVPDHPPARTDFDWALGSAGDVMERGLPYVEAQRRALVEGALEAFRRRQPDFLGLGSQMIHGDVNDHNVIVDPEGREVAAIIDMGDAHSAPRVFDVAIAVAYAVMDTDDPLHAAAELVAGFHEVSPLLEEELDVIVPLARARLGQSVCIAAWRRHLGEADPYHLVSEAPAWRLLEIFAQVREALATGLIRAACGLEPCPGSEELSAWLEAQRGAVHPVVEWPEDPARVGVLDLSVGSPVLTGRDTDDTDAFTRRVWDAMEEAGLEAGLGRYLEPRAFYLSDAFGGREGDPRERRTVHLGLDVFVEAGTPVYAPLPGRVRSVRDNAGRLDYGPTVILEHDGPAGPFWTLYGHLDAASVATLTPGEVVEAGRRIGRVGAPPENGDWPPHLHLQVVADLLGFERDFPGVCEPRDVHVWASFSPDPAPLLGVKTREDAPALATTFRAPDPGELIQRRRRVLGPNLSLSYREPIHMVRGLGAYLYDVMGRRYLDMVNNVAHVGHEHPRVVRAGQRQMAVLNTNTRYLHERVIEYAERLGALLPQPLSVCFFVNSGSEANELALRLARTATGGRGVVVLEGGYHGSTGGLVEVSHYKFAGRGGEGPPPWVRAAPMPDPYRGRYRALAPEEQAERYAEDVAEAFRQLAEAGHRPAAFLSEPILSCGGQIEPPAGYLPEAYARAREAGAVCIADEVQTGLGRVGSHWWAFEAQGALPDIVTLGKPIGNGHPVGAVITSPEIARAFDTGMEFFSTFGGNPVSAAVGLAVLEVMEEEGLRELAARMGARLAEGLRGLMAEHPCVGDVRGRGLFLGVEFVRDPETREPAPEVAAVVVERSKERGVLLSTDGPDHTVIKIKPPLVVREEDVDRVVAVVGEALAAATAAAAYQR